MVRTTPSPICCCDFQRQSLFRSTALAVLDPQGIIDLGHRITRKFDVDHGADTLNNFSLTHFDFPSYFNSSIASFGSPH